jgi:hypothetical protein
MPIRKPTDEKADVSLFKSYVLSLGEDTATLARGSGVSRSRIYAGLDPPLSDRAPLHVVVLHRHAAT